MYGEGKAESITEATNAEISKIRAMAAERAAELRDQADQLQARARDMTESAAMWARLAEDGPRPDSVARMRP